MKNYNEYLNFTEEELNKLPFCIKMEITQKGTDELRDKLINDSSSNVRENIAMYGNNKHREALLADPYWGVREVVALYGNVEQLKILIKDEVRQVRTAVRWRMKRLGLKEENL